MLISVGNDIVVPIGNRLKLRRPTADTFNLQFVEAYEYDSATYICSVTVNKRQFNKTVQLNVSGENNLYLCCSLRIRWWLKYCMSHPGYD